MGQVWVTPVLTKLFCKRLPAVLSCFFTLLRVFWESCRPQQILSLRWRKEQREQKKKKRRLDHRGNLCFSRSAWMGGLGIYCDPCFHPLAILQSAVGALAWRGSKPACFPARALLATLTFYSYGSSFVCSSGGTEGWHPAARYPIFPFEGAAARIKAIYKRGHPPKKLPLSLSVFYLSRQNDRYHNETACLHVCVWMHSV